VNSNKVVLLQRAPVVEKE